MACNYNLVAVIGPTASGKTAFAAHLASQIDGEIISADSRQIYRRMNLGTGKDYHDYLVGGKQTPVHLIDIAEPGYKYSVFEYKRDFLKAYAEITRKGKMAILCGGSGLYIDAATRSYRLDEVPVNEKLRSELLGKTPDELKNILSSMKKLHNKTDVDTVEHALRAIEIEDFYSRVKENKESLHGLNTLYLGVIFDRTTERERITQRLESRLQDGLIDEVQQLLQSGIPAESLLYYGLEYRFITQYLQGMTDYETMKTKLNIAIHQFAKRQRTWFRKMEREGVMIHWIEGNLPMKEKIGAARRLLNC